MVDNIHVFPSAGTFLKRQPSPRFTAHNKSPERGRSKLQRLYTRPFGGCFFLQHMELVDRVVAVLDRLPREANPAIEFSMKCESEDAVDKGRAMAAEASVGVGCSGGEPDVNPNRAVVALALLGVLQRCPPRTWGCCSCSPSCSEILCLRVILLWRRRGVGVAGWGGGVPWLLAKARMREPSLSRCHSSTPPHRSRTWVRTLCYWAMWSVRCGTRASRPPPGPAAVPLSLPFVLLCARCVFTRGAAGVSARL